MLRRKGSIFFSGSTVVQPYCNLCRTVRSEFLVYDGWSLAGDVGGMVGMLLGTSCLAFYDQVVVVGGRTIHKTFTCPVS